MTIPPEGRHVTGWKARLLKELHERCGVTDEEGHRVIPPQLDANQVMLAIFAAEQEDGL